MDCFYFGAILNNAAMDTRVHVFMYSLFSVLLSRFLGTELSRFLGTELLVI